MQLPLLLPLNSLQALFLSFRRVLNVICSFLGNSPASEFSENLDARELRKKEQITVYKPLCTACHFNRTVISSIPLTPYTIHTLSQNAYFHISHKFKYYASVIESY